MTPPTFVKVELIGNRGELTLNRPQQKNALIGPLVNQLHDGLTQLINDKNCHAILIRGEGGCFCAGLDVKAFFADTKPDWLPNFQQDWINFHSEVFTCKKPIVAALEKFAIAGGSALALACDFLVVGKQSFLHVSEVERGMAAPNNIAWLVLKFGRAKAIELAVLGERIYGDKLLSMGLANRCVGDDQVLLQARELADRLAGFNATNVQALKACIHQAQNADSFEAVVARIKAAQV